ncbi:efflux RND transporter permease subunit [Calycomorphotria hydatis]|uniref:MMPL family protein n=1 Tax=Calycomorphotria hydatis TaxID=2528027 RepID=A0A517TBF8_9PLAN|nr:MMPL family transporter [Calycomorphotria hydatis]QDT65705.1 MMPL family protein [Calycomorphotria hydatis]
MSSLVDTLIRYRVIVFCMAIALAVCAFGPSRSLEFDRSIESLYGPDDPILVDFRESKQLFGGDEFVIVAWSDEDPLTNEGLVRIRSSANQFSELPGVNPDGTQHLASMLALEGIDAVLGDSFGPFRLMVRRGAQIAMRNRLVNFSRGILIGTDDHTVAVVLRLFPSDETEITRTQTFAEIRRVASEHDPPAAVAGEPIQIHDAFRYVNDDGRILFQVSLGLLAVVLLILFRNLRWVLLPVTVVLCSVVWTRGFLYVTDAKLSMVSSVLNALVTIIGIAAVTHVAVRFRTDRQTYEPVEALRATILHLASPIFWAAATTAVGFLSLLVSDLNPVKSFGLMMGLGTVMALIAATTIVPGGALIGRFPTDPKSAPGEGLLTSALAFLSRITQRYPVLVGFMATAIVAFAVSGLSKLTVETDFSKNFRSDSPIVKALNFVENRLGGAGSWEVNFPTPEKLNDDFLNDVRTLSSNLRELTIDGEQPLTKVVAITDGLDLLPGLVRQGDPEEDLAMIARMQPDFEKSLYNRDHQRMRIVLRALERQPAEMKRRIITAVNEEARGVFPEAKATGIYVLLTYLIESLLSDQLYSFTVAACGIFLMMCFALRSLPLALMSLVPNVLPIVLVLGGMGWLNIPVNIGTAMIASVSIGLTIDSSIHYLIGFRRHRLAGLDAGAAMERTHQDIGRALVFATLALSAGFAVLMLSHFIPLVYFGMLTSLALIGGLLGNLILLPWMLTIFRRFV